MRMAFVLCFLTFLLPSAAQAMTERTLEHDGYERRFLVHMPAHVQPGKKLPVVLVLHGGGGDADGMVRTTSMDETADKYGFIAVFPQGTTARGMKKFNTWNGGRCCGSAQKNNVDDVGFITTLIDLLIREYNADERRIFATGHSNGAQMSYRLSCELSERIAAIAPNGSQLVFDDCHPKRPVPVMHFHGTEDPCAFYDGGEECGGCFSDHMTKLGLPIPRKVWACDPVPEALQTVARRNGCAMETDIWLERGDVTCERFKGCGQADVNLCTIEGGGHSWPGGNYAPKACERRPNGKICQDWGDHLGEINRDISANELMWKFFQLHPMR